MLKTTQTRLSFCMFQRQFFGFFTLNAFVGADNFKQRFPEGKTAKGSITYVNNPTDALKDANVCFIFTEWGDIKAVLPEDYKKLMRTPLVYDGRNIYEPKDMESAGVEYYSIGR